MANYYVTIELSNGNIYKAKVQSTEKDLYETIDVLKTALRQDQPNGWCKFGLNYFAIKDVSRFNVKQVSLLRYITGL